MASVTGMLVATGAMLVVNRLLPTDLPHHAYWQQAVFWLSWMVTLGHAAWRAPAVRDGLSPAWSEQSALVAMLAAGAVLANSLTTGDHLVRTVAQGYWPVAGVDAVLLVSAGLAGFAAFRVRARPKIVSAAPSPPKVRAAAHA